jgi:hypothetical protein
VFHEESGSRDVDHSSTQSRRRLRTSLIDSAISLSRHNA